MRGPKYAVSPRGLGRLSLLALGVTLAVPAVAHATDPVIVQNATAFQPPEVPPPRAATGLGQGLALGLSAGVGTYAFGPAQIQFTRYGQGLAEYVEGRAGWYIHRTASISLTMNYMTSTTSEGRIDTYRPGIAYRFHPTTTIWGQFEINFLAAPFHSYDPNGTSGVGYGLSAQLSAGVVLWTTPSFIVEGEVAGGSEIFESPSGTFAVPFTLGLSVDYL